MGVKTRERWERDLGNRQNLVIRRMLSVGAVGVLP